MTCGTIKIKTTVMCVCPADPEGRAKFQRALDRLAEAHPIGSDFPESSPRELYMSAAFALVAENLDQIDPDDGTDYAKALVCAFNTARADFAARSSHEGGTA